MKRTVAAAAAAVILAGGLSPAYADEGVYPGDIPTRTTIDKPPRGKLPKAGEKIRFSFETDANAGDVDLPGRYRIRLYRRTLDKDPLNPTLLSEKWRRAQDGEVTARFAPRPAGPYRLQVRYFPPKGSVFRGSGNKIRFTIR